MAEHRLTLFGADEVTVLADCGTAAGHARPYLLLPESFAESEVDLLRGSSVIAQGNLRILDKRTDPADQRTGWFTARLATAGGESAINGVRALWERSEDGMVFTTVLDGVVFRVALEDSLVSYALEIRDTREREREHRAFARTGTTTILPRGVRSGYGALPGGGWLVPPTPPYRATVAVGAFGVVSFGLPTIDRRRPPVERVVPSATRDALTPVYDDRRGGILVRDVSVLWRPATGGSWSEIPEPFVPLGGSPFLPGVGGTGLLSVLRGEHTTGAGEALAVDVLTGIHVVQPLVPGPADPPFPAHGQSVDVMVLRYGPPSEDFPFHFEGTFGELLRNLYRGDYSALDAAGAVVPPGVRYDEAAVLALDTPCRLRLTEPADDLREWVQEHIYQPVGAAPALDAQGRVSPVRYALPDTAAPLFEFTDANCATDASWEHPADDAINSVEVTYERDFRIPPEQDPDGTRAASDTVVSRDVVVRRVFQDSVERVGERKLEIKPATLRALGGADGQPASGDVTDERGSQLAEERARQATDRFLYGAQAIRLRCLRSACASVRVGDWALLSLSWLPDYAAGRRGSNRLVQVVSAQDLDGVWRSFRVEDAGPANVPLGPPTLGVPVVSTDGILSVPVTAVPAGGLAAVQYAVAPALPGSDSGAWVPLGRVDAPSALTSPPLPAGATVWVRARGEAEGRIRSAWTTPVSTTAPSTPRVLSVTAAVDLATGAASVAWTRNGYALGVRVHYSVHAVGAAAAFSAYQDASAAAGSLVLGGVTVQPGQALTVELEPWTGWTGSAVSGAAGTRVRGDADRAADGTTYSVLSVRIVEQDETTARAEARVGAAVDEVAVYTQLVPVPYIGGTDPKETGTYTGTHVVSEGRVLHDFEKPHANVLLLASFVPLDVDLGVQGRSREIAIPPAEPVLGEGVRAVPREGEPVVDVEVFLSDPSASAFPVTVQVMLEDVDATPIVEHTFTLGSSYVIGPADYPPLGGIALPERRPLPVIARFVDVAGNVRLARDHPNRDPLPFVQPAVDDYRTDAAVSMYHDDDTDEIRVLLAGVVIKTWPGLTGAGWLQYVVGVTAVDGGGTEVALKVGEPRGEYVIEADGGGVTVEVWRGYLHGASPLAPRARPDYTLNADRTEALVTVVLESDTDERVGLRWRDSQDPDVDTYALVHADEAPRLEVSGTRIESAALFDEGPGAPVAKMTVPLRSGQIVTRWVQAYAEDSGVSGPWTPVQLSLLEKPQLTSLRGTYNPTNGQITTEVVGGVHAQSVLVEAADNPAFTGAFTQALTLTEGAVVAPVFAVPAAKRHGDWHLRATAYNGTLSGGAPTGLAGDPMTATVSIREEIAYELRVEKSADFTTGVVRLYIRGGTAQVGSVGAYVWLGSAAKPASLTPATVAGDGHYFWTVPLDRKHLWYVEVVITRADGTTVSAGAPVGLDPNNSADVDTPDVSYVSGTATIKVPARDSDIAQVYVQRWSTSTSAWITHAFGAPDAATRIFSATRTQAATSTLMRAYGVNAQGVAGTPIEFVVEPLSSGSGIRLAGASAYRNNDGACANPGNIQNPGGVAVNLTHRIEWIIENPVAGYVITLRRTIGSSAYFDFATNLTAQTGGHTWEPYTGVYGARVHTGSGLVTEGPTVVRYTVLLVRSSDGVVVGSLTAEVEDRLYNCT